MENTLQQMVTDFNQSAHPEDPGSSTPVGKVLHFIRMRNTSILLFLIRSFLICCFLSSVWLQIAQIMNEHHNLLAWLDTKARCNYRLAVDLTDILLLLLFLMLFRQLSRDVVQLGEDMGLPRIQ
jgi:hypothetical protein